MVSVIRQGLQMKGWKRDGVWGRGLMGGHPVCVNPVYMKLHIRPRLPQTYRPGNHN